MTKRMTTGTDREKWLAASALIEHKTNEGSTKQEGVVDLGDGETLAYEPNLLIRWDGWLLEWKNLTALGERVEPSSSPAATGGPGGARSARGRERRDDEAVRRPARPGEPDDHAGLQHQ